MGKELRKIINYLSKLVYILTPAQKRLAIVYIVLSVIGAALETMGISVVIPLVNSLLNPDAIMSNKYFSPLLKIFNVDKSNVLIFVCAMVIIVYFLKNLYLIGLLWYKQKYAGKFVRELAGKMMQTYMNREYPFFLQVDQGQLTQGTTGDAGGIYALLLSLFSFISEALTLGLIVAFVVISDWKMAISLMICGAVSMMIVLVFFKKRVKSYGVQTRKKSEEYSAAMLESYGGIKEIIVSKSQNYFVNRFNRFHRQFQDIIVKQTVASGSPSYIIEFICVSGVICAVAIHMLGVGASTSYIANLAVVAMAAFRIMPSLGRLSGHYNQIVFYSVSLDKGYERIKEVEEYNRKWVEEHNSIIPGDVLYFQKGIAIRNVCWSYEKKRDVLTNLNLEILKNQCIGIIGPSGSGKSTLMDVLLGLLKPQSGSIYCDEKDVYDYPDSWAKLVGYVPQTVYITNEPIRNNVAFGFENNEIDDERVWKALDAACATGFVRELPEGINTLTGERGIRLSGGQRQRIAIARALYRNPEIIVFDEATSALDNETESAVMQSIEQLLRTMTMIIVAHRLTTVRHCDRIYKIENGKATEVEKSTLEI